MAKLVQTSIVRIAIEIGNFCLNTNKKGRKVKLFKLKSVILMFILKFQIHCIHATVGADCVRDLTIKVEARERETKLKVNREDFGTLLLFVKFAVNESALR
jgi:hypothetical protein